MPAAFETDDDGLFEALPGKPGQERVRNLQDIQKKARFLLA